MSLVTTFLVSGALHDLAASAVAGRRVFILTPWFFIMGVGVVIGQAQQMIYSRFVWPVRALVNICYMGMTFALTYAVWV